MIIGQTNNPYDNRRTVGGSSGGEGAAITSCMTPIGLGKIWTFSVFHATEYMDNPICFPIF